MKYTNKEFLQHLQKTFKEPYDFGMHNINLECYKSVAKKEKRYRLNKNNITTEDIAKNILQMGLFVYEKDRGITSTVQFIENVNKINEGIFNYSFQSKEEQSLSAITNILVAIPNVFLIENKEYSIRDNHFFKDCLPSAFIYGYYIKKVSFNPRAFYPRIYADDLEFNLNKQHILLKCKEEREEIVKRVVYQQNSKQKKLINEK